MIYLLSPHIPDELLFVMAFVAVFVIQFLLLFKVKNKFLKFTPVIVFAITSCVFLVLTFSVGGWDAVGYLLLSVLSFSLLFDSLAAIVVGALARWINKIRTQNLI